MINLLIEQKVADVNWQLARIVQQILQISSLMDLVTFSHIPREWNRTADRLAKWASEHAEGWRMEDWELAPEELYFDLRRILDDDRVEEDVR